MSKLTFIVPTALFVAFAVGNFSYAAYTGVSGPFSYYKGNTRSESVRNASAIINGYIKEGYNSNDLKEALISAGFECSEGRDADVNIVGPKTIVRTHVCYYNYGRYLFYPAKWTVVVRELADGSIQYPVQMADGYQP